MKLRWPVLGVTLVAAGIAFKEASIPEAPQIPSHTCAFENEREMPALYSTTTGKIVGAMTAVTEVEGRVVKGRGVIYPNKQEPLEIGVVFTADFNNRTCAVKHFADSWDQETVKGPMEDDFRSMQFAVR